MSARLNTPAITQPPPRGVVHGIIAALCAPTVVGVLIFSVLALLPNHPDPSWNPWQPVSLTSAIVSSLAMVVVFAGFFGTAYGPLLLPFAAGVLVHSRNRGTPRTGALWVYVGLGLVATAIGWSWALDAVELP